MAIKQINGPNFYGGLVAIEDKENIENKERYKDLDIVARDRKRKYRELTVLKTEKSKYLEKGWEIRNELKHSLKIRKDKDCDEFLEDEVWTLFKNMGFQEMNEDGNFKIQAGSIKSKIGVFAKDENNIFVIKCKAQPTEGLLSLQEDLKEILNQREQIIESIKNHYGRKLRVTFLLITRNILWIPAEEKIASQNEKNGFYFWKESDLEAFKELNKNLGDSTKYQLFAVLFHDKEAKEIGDITIPAIFGGKGRNKFYSFIIQPEKLLRVAYVHRREESNPKKVSGTYQRMVKEKKLRGIRNFIDDGGFFANNIIINFTKKPIFEKKDTLEDIKFGILKFPKYYGSAWIIDGQHRLYGYSNTERKYTDTVPVVAFEGIKHKRQANIFVEINREQTPVNKNLLWDLYPDIYEGIDDEECQLLSSISLIVKKLNSEPDSPLYNRIKIPSSPKVEKKITNLTLTNICDGIKENKLIDREEGLLYHKDYETSIDFAYERLKTYFNLIANSFKEDWEKGDKGLLRTNVGIRIFLIILRAHLRFLKYKGLKNTIEKKDLTEFEKETKKTLGYTIEKLKKEGQSKRDDIRGGSTKGKVLENTQWLLWDLKEKYNFGIELWRKGGWHPRIPKDQRSKEYINKLVEETENELRSFAIKILKDKHGNFWWRRGVPETVKKQVDEVIEKEINKAPYRKKQLKSLSGDKKIMYSSTAHLRVIVTDENNWGLFEDTFAKDKIYTQVQFLNFENLRNKYVGHTGREKEMDKIEKELSYWGTRWLRRCIGLDSK